MPRKYRVLIGPDAEQDIRSIQAYIAQDKPGAARKWVETLGTRIRSLETFPEGCEVIPEAPDVGSDYRHLIVGNYRVLFRMEGNRVIVVRVIHGARLLRPSMLPEP